jgi:hypothetical protein
MGAAVNGRIVAVGNGTRQEKISGTRMRGRKISSLQTISTTTAAACGRRTKQLGLPGTNGNENLMRAAYIARLELSAAVNTPMAGGGLGDPAAGAAASAVAMNCCRGHFATLWPSPCFTPDVLDFDVWWDGR